MKKNVELVLLLIYTNSNKEFMLNKNIQKAAELINNAETIVIGAGARMGVDSGL